MVERVAITGAAGFVGAHLVEAFTASGVRVLPLVRSLDIRAKRWPEAMTLDSALRDPAALDGCEVIVHAAAVRHRHGVDAAEYARSNIELVRWVMTAAAGRVRRVLLVSSVGVYGYPDRLPITEEHPYGPVTQYAETKVQAERLATRLASELGLELCILRPTIVYGRGDRNGMLDKMVRMMRRGTYLVVGRGDNTLHHTHVDDVVNGVLIAATHPAAAGEHFILCGPETISLQRFSVLVAQLLGERLPRLHLPLGPARAIAMAIDVASSRGLAFSRREPPINGDKLDVMTRSIAFDASKATRMLGYRPAVGYEEGLRRTLTDTP
jgi:dihydroflavonol-4-reductase